MHEKDPRFRPQPDIPNDLDGAIYVLEDQLFADLKFLEENEPDPLVPLSMRIAYTIANARVRADGDVITSLHQERARLEDNNN